MLPPVKRRIDDLVCRHPGIAAERLRELVWIDDPAGGPEDPKVLYVHVSQLNQQLAPYGIEIWRISQSRISVPTHLFTRQTIIVPEVLRCLVMSSL